MTGFDYYIPYRNYEKTLLVKESIFSKMADEESHVLTYIYKTLRDPDADLSIFTSFHEKADMIFITCKPVEELENRYEYSGFCQCMRSIYPYINISGYYGLPQDTYCFFNIVEDTRRFIFDTMGLVNLCYQENALIIPRKKKGEVYYSLFTYLAETNKYEIGDINNITGEIEKYFNRYKSDSNQSSVRSYAEYIAKAERTLVSRLSEENMGSTCSWKMRFRRDVSSILDIKDENFYKQEWGKLIPKIKSEMNRRYIRLLVLGY